jgi:group II intron reverse transcriptase/maturase
MKRKEEDKQGAASPPTSGPPKRRKHKAHSLTGRISLFSLAVAFDRVKHNNGTEGIDKVTIPDFKANLVSNLEGLKTEIKEGRYQPSPLRRVGIPKANGKIRPLSIPTIRDRTAQETIRRLIEPIFEPIFHDNSFGFRPGRNCHDALKRIKEYHTQGFRWVVDADIVGCFDNIPFKAIMQSLSWEVADGKILTAIERSLKAGFVENGRLQPSTKGTPQGGPISPLLANIVLNRFDWHLAQAGYRFVRYADDFVILCRTKHDAEKALSFARESLHGLGLEISQEKTRIACFREGFDFLGSHITSHHFTMKDAAIKRFKDKVRIITIRSRNLDSTVINRLNATIRGTANYFGVQFTATRTQFRRLDQFVRKRVRCMKKKRIRHTDNIRLPTKMLQRWGVLSLQGLHAKSPPYAQ